MEEHDVVDDTREDSDFDSSGLVDSTLDSISGYDTTESLAGTEPTPIEDLSENLLCLNLKPTSDIDSDPEDGGANTRE